MTKLLDYVDLENTLNDDTPKNILKYALKEFDSIAVSFSGAEDVVLVDMASKIKPGVDVFCLDTGRLHKETYAFIDKVREHYDISLKIVFPEAKEVEALVEQKGLFSFYKDGHSECCGIRKVNPLRKILAGYDAWITGQRKDQSPNTRTDIPVIQKDLGFSTDSRTLTKFNPLANWSSEDVWMYIRMFDVPYNPLHEQGFISIGCEPCTKPVHPGQHEREGRWWWEEATQKECGLHLDAAHD